MENHRERVKKYSNYWFNRSSDLKGTAAALWIAAGDKSFCTNVVQKCGFASGFSIPMVVSEPFLMICGMSLELFFKAVAMEKGVAINMSHHDLRKHAKIAELKYSTQDSELLEILSHYVSWAGRYPTPKSDSEYDRLQKLHHKRFSQPSPAGFGRVPVNPLEWEDFSRLWNVAYVEFSTLKLSKGEWSSGEPDAPSQ